MNTEYVVLTVPNFRVFGYKIKIEMDGAIQKDLFNFQPFALPQN